MNDQLELALVVPICTYLWGKETSLTTQVLLLHNWLSQARTQV